MFSLSIGKTNLVILCVFIAIAIRACQGLAPVLQISKPTTSSNSSNSSNTSTNNGTGDQCESDFFPCSDKIVGNLVLIVFYGAILGGAAKLISDGAEMLLDLNFPPAIIGGVVLPVMGAVPDSVMIVVSGLGPADEVQDQISVGMGTLAGSTILLLTIAWGASLIVGRTDIERQPNGTKACAEKECTGFRLTWQGVQVSRQVMFVAVGMLGTMLPYIIVQASDWKFGPTKVKEKQPEYVQSAALASMIICFIGFVAYLVSQFYASTNDEDSKVNVLLRMRGHKMAAHAAFTFMQAGEAQRGVAQVTFPEGGEEEPHSEFSTRVALNYGRLWRMKARAAAQARAANNQDNEFNSDRDQLVQNDEEGEPEMPKWKIAINSFGRLIGGVAIVTIFSDPMCDALTALTDKDNAQHIPISAFYVSFVVTPLCSNASELVSSILLAMQKEKDKINMTYSQIYGACIMNNTLCLGVFCALVYFRSLEWYFSAEVTVILLFEIILGITAIVFRHIYTLYLSFIVIAFYPISLGMVAFMEGVMHWG